MVVKRAHKQPVTPRAEAPLTRRSAVLRMLGKVHSRVHRWSSQPFWWMTLGGLMAFLGYTVVDISCGNCLERNKYPATDHNAEHQSLFSEVTGPFQHNPEQMAFVQCLLTGTFQARHYNGDCKVVQDMFHKRLINTLDWDLNSCRKFVRDPLDTVFFQPVKVRWRNNTDDALAMNAALCGADSKFLIALAQHLPPDRPLVMLDAGAHIGFTTLLLARLSKFHGKIIALEPSRHNMQALRVNTDNITHLVTRMHGIVAPEPLAARHRILNMTGGLLKEYLGGEQFRRFTTMEDQVAGHIFYDSHVLPPGAGTVPEGDGVPTISLRKLREFAPTRRFDVIRIDMYGTAKKILRDPGSREIICQATCLVVARHGHELAGGDWALKEFEDHGCPSSHRLVRVGSAGKYEILCQEQAALAARQRAEEQAEAVQKRRRRKQRHLTAAEASWAEFKAGVAGEQAGWGLEGLGDRALD